MGGFRVRGGRIGGRGGQIGGEGRSFAVILQKAMTALVVLS